VAAVFLFDLLVAPRGWCGHVCPVGAAYALIGSKSLLRVSARHASQVQRLRRLLCRLPRAAGHPHAAEGQGRRAAGDHRPPTAPTAAAASTCAAPMSSPLPTASIHPEGLTMQVHHPVQDTARAGRWPVRAGAADGALGRRRRRSPREAAQPARRHAAEQGQPSPALRGRSATTRPVDRDFVQQPPLIPHTINGYQITKNFNKCMDCHAFRSQGGIGATKVSVTHFRTREGQELDNISPRRYFCTQCHVPQTDARPLVENTVPALVHEEMRGA
jgi:nitrate reductase cytochrome c-type subunit